jgi:cell division protein ZapA (FtsZ GTPase activity inhibitor)
MASPPSPPAPPAPGPAPLCPACHSPIPLAARFCPSCGASTTAAPARAPSAPVDIRQAVDQDRGTLKKLQLLLPGYRGYRQGEDLRDADSILRRQIADKVHACVNDLTSQRQQLVLANEFTSLTTIATVLSDLQTLEGRIRHAEQGFSGISPAVRITQVRQDQLYEYDYGFAQAAEELRAATAPLQSAIAAHDNAAITAQVEVIRGLVARLRAAFEVRMATVEKVQV